MPPQTGVASLNAAPRGDLTRLFGVDAPPPPVEAAPPPSTRFQLVGVVAPRGGAQGGVALIAVDGKPARAYRVGATIDGDTVLQQVRQRGASLGPRDGVANVSLEIPPPAPAATGTLPPAAGLAPVAPPPPVARPLPPVSATVPPPGVRPSMPPNVQPGAIAPPPVGRPEGLQTQ